MLAMIRADSLPIEIPLTCNSTYKLPLDRIGRPWTCLEGKSLRDSENSMSLDLLRWMDLRAAFRGMNVIIPVDGMSAVDPYAEYSTVFTFMNAPSVSAKTTLTRSDMI